MSALEERPVARVAPLELGTRCRSAARLASADPALGGNALASGDARETWGVLRRREEIRKRVVGGARERENEAVVYYFMIFS